MQKSLVMAFSFLSLTMQELFPEWTDIHAHLLPGVDDGSRSLEDSLEILHALSNRGLSKMVFTPHVMAGCSNPPEKLRNVFEKFRDRLEQTGVRLALAGEYMLDENFEEMLEKDALLTYDGNHLLVEMSVMNPFLNYEQLLYKACLKGYVPIMAHPERYFYFMEKKDFFESMKDKGYKFQLNLLSLFGYYGIKTKFAAERLLKKGIYEFVGTDIHRLSQLNHLDKINLRSHQKELVSLFTNNNQLFFPK